MLSDTPPTYVGTKRRTGPMDFHINKMRALNLSAKYMKKVEAELRGLPGTFNDLPVTPLMNIGEMVDSSAFDQVNKATADALKGKRMRKMASQTILTLRISLCTQTPMLTPNKPPVSRWLYQHS